MERVQQVVHRLDARVTSPDLVNDRKQRQTSGVWRALSLFDATEHTPLFIALYVAWDTLCLYVIGLSFGYMFLNCILVLGFACVQYAFQVVLVVAIKFLYANYAWLAALGGTLRALLQREFPVQASGAHVMDPAQYSYAYKERIDAQRKRLHALVTQYPARDRIALCNDLEPDEPIYPQNLKTLAALGYHLASNDEPDYRNALVVGKDTTTRTTVMAPRDRTCVLF